MHPGKNDGIRLKWYGAAHYCILYKDLRIVIDPLFSRLPGDVPHLDATKETTEKMDYILLTHGHLDHSRDFPYLLFKHDPVAFAPAAYLNRLKKQTGAFDFSKCRNLETVEGIPETIADIEMTPYRIGTEDIDFWFLRSMFLRPLIHLKIHTIPFGIRWLGHFAFGNCFSLFFRFPPAQKTMLYFGNLTDKVENLNRIDRVSVLAIPYCPANSKWLEQSIFLINRFTPDVTLVHHFDNFMNPYTDPRYMNLGNYQKRIYKNCPNANLYFSKFNKEILFDDIRQSRTGLNNIQGDKRQ